MKEIGARRVPEGEAMKKSKKLYDEAKKLEARARETDHREKIRELETRLAKLATRCSRLTLDGAYSASNVVFEVEQWFDTYGDRK